jgi:hypothetical protein
MARAKSNASSELSAPPLDRQAYRRAIRRAAEMGLPPTMAIAVLDGAYAAYPTGDFESKARRTLERFAVSLHGTSQPDGPRVVDRLARREAYLAAHPELRASAEATRFERSVRRRFTI